jgi:hypothetical protein
MTLRELTEYCQAQAIADKLSPDEVSVWRSVCRAYAKKFNTPLHTVLLLDPETVFLHYYEDQLEDLDPAEHLDKMMDIIYTLEDPEYEKTKRDEFDRFIEIAEAVEQERVKAGKPVHPGLKSQTTLQDKPVTVPETPKSGYVNLSYLEKEESEGDFG